MANRYIQDEKKSSTGPLLREHPRPQMERESCLILNGIWGYAITRSEQPPPTYGEILVPFSPESTLSGVERRVGPKDFLWYRRTFQMPKGFNKGCVLLHFGAVDQCCTVYINRQNAGGHDGGYLPFSVDITPYLQEGENEILVMVIDETDTAPYARGRQRLKPGGQWHTPQSGIWQTVWLESMPAEHLENVKITPLYDEGRVRFEVEMTGGLTGGEIEIYALQILVMKGDFEAGKPLELDLPNALPWTPAKPFLYTVRVHAGKDAVKSYFGMRKFSLAMNENGTPRFYLNNRPLLLCGIFDQGMYKDSLYTPPSDAAMLYDIKFAKACGFNTIRKHGKIEPLRWYYHCDRLGMLVWQDLPSGGEWVRERKNPETRRVKDNRYRRMGRANKEGRLSFVRDLALAAKLLYNTPALMGWVLFNEGWGQFDAAKLAAKMKELDPTRLVDHASGRFDQGAGDIKSFHLAGLTPGPPGRAEASALDTRAMVLTACGGFGLFDPMHFNGKTPQSAMMVEDERRLEDVLRTLWLDRLVPLAKQDLAGYFYVQLSDTEDEVSGLLTADRRREKVDPLFLAELNNALCAIAIRKKGAR